MRILLVEDDTRMSASVAGYLRASGTNEFAVLEVFMRLRVVELPLDPALAPEWRIRLYASEAEFSRSSFPRKRGSSGVLPGSPS